jgi:hypothetical protein
VLTRRLPCRRLAAAIVAAAAAAALPLAAAAPARADQVRQRELWVLSAVHAHAAWRVTQGRGVLVAVLDSGVDPSVSDLSGSVIAGPNLTDVPTRPSNPNWGVHGTWMASLIAGHGHGRGHASGIIGVAPKARILSIRVITDRSDPGYRRYQQQPSVVGQRELARAIWIAVARGAGVISMSLGYTQPSAPVRAALQYAVNHNVVVVASAGNSGSERIALGHGHAPYSFPADYPGVIGVAAVNAAGRPASFSSGNFSVQVAAPGVNVPAAGRHNRYWLVSGTSPACALTAGVAALVRAKYPTLTAAQVRLAILRSAWHRPATGYNDEVGFGTVNAAAALTAAGRLAKQAPAGNSAAAVAAAAGNFGGGPHAVPRVPVPPRAAVPFRYLYAAAAGSLLLLLLSLWRLAAGLAARGAARRSAAWPQATAPPGPPPALAGLTVDPRYVRPGPGYQGPVAPAQQWLSQQWIAQPQPVQPPVPAPVPQLAPPTVVPTPAATPPDQQQPKTPPAAKPAREPRTRPWRRLEAMGGQTGAAAEPVTRPDIPAIGQSFQTLPKRIKPADREPADGQPNWDPWTPASSPAPGGSTEETAS